MQFKIGIAQVSPTLGNIEENLKIHKKFIKKAREADVQFLIFPELSLTGYFVKDMVTEVALKMDGEIFQEIVRESCGGLDLVIGFAEETLDYNFYISAAYISNGKVLHIHRKVYLPTYGMFDDRRYFACGDRISAFDTPFGKMGLLICEDMWHLSSVYILSQEKIDFLICISNSPGRGVEGNSLDSIEWWSELSKLYAKFLTVYVVHVNRVGYEDGIAFGGGSMVVEPFGKLLAQAKCLKEDFVVVSVNTNDIRRARLITPILREERLDITIKELERIWNNKFKN